jgi:hypothetical protein
MTLKKKIERLHVSPRSRAEEVFSNGVFDLYFSRPFTLKRI